MMAAIESAGRCVKRSRNRCAIVLCEDYVTNMKTRRYPDGQELFFASMILHACQRRNQAVTILLT